MLAELRRNQILKNLGTSASAVKETAENLAVAFYTIGTLVMPIPDETVLIGAAAVYGYEIVKVGRGSYHTFRNGKRLTGQTEDDAARLILAEAKILPAPSREAGQLDDAFHYTASRWGDVIKQQGLRPGSYATPAGDLGSFQAKLELALPPTRSAPDIRIRIDLEGLRKAGYEIPALRRVSSTVVGPDGRVYQMPGGGWEMQFPYEIPGEFLEVIPIR